MNCVASLKQNPQVNEWDALLQTEAGDVRIDEAVRKERIDADFLSTDRPSVVLLGLVLGPRCRRKTLTSLQLAPNPDT